MVAVLVTGPKPPTPPVGWDVPGWSVVPDRFRRVLIAVAEVDGLTLTIEAESLAELRIAVESRRGRTVTVP